MGWNLVNNSVSGAQAADQADEIFTTAIQASSPYLYMIGTNDNWFYGIDPDKMPIFESAHLDEIAWLGIPDNAKIRGTDEGVVYMGDWSNTALKNGGYGIGKASSNQGDYVTFQVKGSILLIGTIIADGNGGEFELLIDGEKFLGPYHCFGNAPVSTHFGRTYAPALVRIAGLDSGTHTINLTVSSSSSPANQVDFEWAAGVGEGAGFSPSVVYAGNVPRQALETNMAATVWDYSAIVASNVRKLSGDGLDVTYVPVAEYLNPMTDLSVDGIHPIDPGEAHIGEAFLDVMQAGADGGGAPAVASAGVVNAFSGRYGLLIPGEVVSVYGVNLGPANAESGSFDSQTLRLPVSLGGVSVRLGGIDAPLYFVSENQIDAQVPFELAGLPNADLVITSNNQVSASYKMGIGTASLGVFPAVFNADGSVNSSSNPAHAGGAVVVYATGQGVTNPASITGREAIPGSLPGLAFPLAAEIDGIPVSILFSGQAPFTAGVMQLNLGLPAGLTGEDLPLRISINQIPSFALAGGMPSTIVGFVTIK